MNGVLITKEFIRRSHNVAVGAYISTPTTCFQSNTTSSLLRILVQPALGISVGSPGLDSNSILPLRPSGQSYWQSRYTSRAQKPDYLAVSGLETLISILKQVNPKLGGVLCKA